MRYTVFDEVPVEPTYQQAQALVDQCDQALRQICIIAVGGGSVMDAAKLVSMLVSDTLTVKRLA